MVGPAFFGNIKLFNLMLFNSFSAMSLHAAAEAMDESNSAESSKRVAGEAANGTARNLDKFRVLRSNQEVREA